MNEASPRVSKILLSLAVAGAGLNLAASVRARGVRRAFTFFALAVGLPAAGELLATGPLKLLRHRTRPRVAGVPVAVLLGWYCVIRGSFAVAGRLLDRLPLDGDARRRALPPVAALVGTSLDLVMDPAGLDVGLWEWNADGAYAAGTEGPNGHRGVPLVNYAGWLLLVGGAVAAHGRLSGDRGDTGRLPGLLLLLCYLAAAAWALRRRRFRCLIYSAPFPVALLIASTNPDS